MAKIILFEMISLDGYFEDANRDISWHNVDADFNEFAIDQLNNASALMFGRKTYELMASYWPAEPALQDDPVVAGIMNSIRKIVFSRTLTRSEWANTELHKNNLEKLCLELKAEQGKDIFVFGSANLASELISLNLIDEFRIMVSPIVLGSGVPLFKPSAGKIRLSLVSSQVFGSGNVMLVYRP